MKAGQTKQVQDPNRLRWAFITAQLDRYDKKTIFIVNTYSRRSTGGIVGSLGKEFQTEKEAMKFAEDFVNN